MLTPTQHFTMIVFCEISPKAGLPSLKTMLLASLFADARARRRRVVGSSKRDSGSPMEMATEADSATSPSETLSRDTLRLGLGGEEGSSKDQPVLNKDKTKLGSISKDPQIVARENLRLGLEAGGGALPGPADLALNQSRGLLQVVIIGLFLIKWNHFN